MAATQSPTSLLPTLIALATILYIIGVALYRLYFHPLAKYPGPFWAKLTQWPEAQSSWRGRRHLDLHAMHEKYGDVVRLAPNSLAFRTPGAIHDIYTDRNANVIKTGWTETARKLNPYPSSQVISDRKLHAARRKLLNQAFSVSAINSMEQYVLKTIRTWCEYLQEPPAVEAAPNKGDKATGGWSRERDIAVWSNLLTLDVLGELCFGASFGAMKAGRTYIADLVLGSGRMILVLSSLPIRDLLMPILKRPALAKIVGGDMSRKRIRFREEMGVLVEKRTALERVNAEKPAEEQRKDFFHYLLHAQDPETGVKFVPKELVGEAGLLVAAGSDTSSATMSAFLFNMLHNERVYKKVQQEVRSAFDEVEEIKYTAKLSGLPYLRACIDETLRIAPPVPGYLARVILPGGAVIDGNTYPAGTVVGTGAYSIHHNANLFEKPFSYIPERWIVGSSDEDPSVPIKVTKSSVQVAKDSFWAFSSGPRVCVGKGMAYMELSITLARLIWLFDIRFAPGHERSGGGGPGKGDGRERENEYQLTDAFVSDRSGPVLQFKRRLVDEF
ncbi:hypothetical protein LTR84_003321 [Exophiala bonariae]|uniref:Uncharacterized protein n=1 Tax=Exophiala bonariae TaxID=1690606 RepID=A0AAV9NAB5_9EURO|nr:hypothetical protein LTR84_003321 [Exophiala bonariae]